VHANAFFLGKRQDWAMTFSFFKVVWVSGWEPVRYETDVLSQGGPDAYLSNKYKDEASNRAVILTVLFRKPVFRPRLCTKIPRLEAGLLDFARWIDDLPCKWIAGGLTLTA